MFPIEYGLPRVSAIDSFENVPTVAHSKALGIILERNSRQCVHRARLVRAPAFSIIIREQHGTSLAYAYETCPSLCYRG
ncbi:hypothetical protein D3C85_1116190 [compost metagenome]